jgi:hydrogenase maturation protease
MLKIVALGNLLRGDDGAGPTIVQKLTALDLGTEIELFDAGADAFILLEYLMQKDPLIIIDCAQMGKNAGDYVVFPVKKSNFETLSSTISMHGFSFAEIYKMALALGDAAPCTIIGIEPKSINFNEGLSIEVEKSIPLIIKFIIEEAKKYAA